MATAGENRRFVGVTPATADSPPRTFCCGSPSTPGSTSLTPLSSLYIPSPPSTHFVARAALLVSGLTVGLADQSSLCQAVVAAENIFHQTRDCSFFLKSDTKKSESTSTFQVQELHNCDNRPRFVPSDTSLSLSDMFSLSVVRSHQGGTKHPQPHPQKMWVVHTFHSTPPTPLAPLSFLPPPHPCHPSPRKTTTTIDSELLVKMFCVSTTEKDARSTAQLCTAERFVSQCIHG